MNERRAIWCWRFYPKLTSRERKAALKANEFPLTRQEWEGILKMFKHRCVCCGKKPRKMTQDHITPISRGGQHTVSNVVPACPSCNRRKGAGSVLRAVQPLLLVEESGVETTANHHSRILSYVTC